LALGVFRCGAQNSDAIGGTADMDRPPAPIASEANQKALIAYAEGNGLAYEYEYTPAFAKWQRLLSPEQYEIVEARTSRGVSRVMLFSKAIIQAEWEANAPLREAMATKRERWRAKRAAIERAAKQRPSKRGTRPRSSGSDLGRSVRRA